MSHSYIKHMPICNPMSLTSYIKADHLKVIHDQDVYYSIIIALYNKSSPKFVECISAYVQVVTLGLLMSAEYFKLHYKAMITFKYFALHVIVCILINYLVYCVWRI